MNDSKLGVIRGLLAKAESTTFESERKAYNAKANQLIAKYGIDEALLAAASEVRTAVEVRDIIVEAPYALDKLTLLNRIYTPLGCKVIKMSNVRADKTVLIKAYGYASDLNRAEILYTSLLIQALRGMAALPSAGHPRTTAANRRAWLLGFGAEVYSRLLVAEKVAAESSDGVSTALVLRDRSEAVSDAFAAAHPSTVTTRRSLSGRGYGAGRAAGARADIGGKRVGGSRTALR